MKRHKKQIWLISITFFFFSCAQPEKEQPVINSIQLDNSMLSLTKEAENLDVPWDLQYDRINDAILFSEIGGTIRRLDIKSKQVTLVDSITDVYQQRTLGLLGMALYQPENDQAYLYLSYTTKTDSLIFSNLFRYDYNPTGKLSNPKQLLQIPGNTGHNGSRIVISPDKKVYWATGDAAIDTYAQDSTSLNGKILRLNLDGSIPEDNPIADSYVYAWGFRNMQGLTYNNNEDILYTSEHGDAIEDEVNLILPLKNYGWPLVEGMVDTHEEKAKTKSLVIEEPIKSWTPVVAPAGIAYYGSDVIPEWKNSLLLATLKNQSLRILTLSDDGLHIVDEHVLFQDQLGRLRSVVTLPNGDIYFCSSNRDWNPQKGFPTQEDDVIYRLRISDKAEGPILRPQTADAQPQAKDGHALYEAYCTSCHKSDGEGLTNTFPPLANSKAVNGDEKKLLQIILHGMQGKTIESIKYEGAMPGFSFLTDEEIITITNYIRTNFGNDAGEITSSSLTSLR